MSYGLNIGVVCSQGIEPDRGGRARNEDNYLICRDGEARYLRADGEAIRRFHQGAGVLLAVADGMGGHRDGALASSAAVQALARLYGRGYPTAPELSLHRFVLKAHSRIRHTIAHRGRVDLGTTLTAAWILDRRAHWIHVGDSRLYHYRDGLLRQITQDHTRGEFARRDRRPPPSRPDALAQNFVYGSVGLGDDGGLRIDPGRDTGSVVLERGDRLVLCSDGLTGVVDDYGLAWALQEVPSPAACAEVLVERAVAKGSNDNITVMVVRVDRLPHAAEPSDPGDSPADDTLVPSGAS